MSESRKYEVEIKEKKGTCDTTLFEKMAKNGDITATKVSELIGVEVKITGYAKCKITTDEKTFDINYFDTEEYGLVSSGSEIFAESVSTYFGEVNSVRLTEVKTKKGKTYKAVPVLSGKKQEQTIENKKETENDLPF
jgi:hypothetical protein